MYIHHGTICPIWIGYLTEVAISVHTSCSHYNTKLILLENLLLFFSKFGAHKHEAASSIIFHNYYVVIIITMLLLLSIIVIIIVVVKHLIFCLCLLLWFLLTAEDQLVLMTRDFDPLTEVALYESEFGEGIFWSLLPCWQLYELKPLYFIAVYNDLYCAVYCRVFCLNVLTLAVLRIMQSTFPDRTWLYLVCCVKCEGNRPCGLWIAIMIIMTVFIVLSSTAPSHMQEFTSGPMSDKSVSARWPPTHRPSCLWKFGEVTMLIDYLMVFCVGFRWELLAYWQFVAIVFVNGTTKELCGYICSSRPTGRLCKEVARHCHRGQLAMSLQR